MDTHRGSLNAGTSGDLRKWVTKIVHTLDGHCYGGGASGTCFCPAHDNTRTPALSVSLRDGKLLVKCHARCSQEAVVAALKKRGLWPNTKQAAAPVVVSKGDQRRREREQEFDDYERVSYAREILYVANQNHSKHDHALLRRYLIECRGLESMPKNAMLLQRAQAIDLGLRPYPAMVLPVTREDKLIAAHVTWLRRDCSDKLNVKDPRRVYAPMQGGYIQLGPIWSTRNLVIGEGVETVESAKQIIGWSAGVAGVSAANLPNIVRYAPPKAKNIIIAADNDEAGHKGAAEVARRFNMQGCRVRIAFPPDGIKDWNDAIREARTDADIAELRDLILNAPIFDERLEARALLMTEVMAMEIPARQYLMEPWLETSSLNMIHGKRGEGKTFLILAISYAIATGTPILGWTPQRQARLLYVDGELPGSLLQQRLKYLGQPTDNLRILSRDILLRDGNIMLPDLATPEGRAFLDKVIEQEDSEVIVLDSLSTLFRAGVENDAESWQEPQDWMLGHRFQGRTIIFAHHEGKNKTPRGTSKREDTLDTSIGIRRRDDLKEDDTESAFEITFTKQRSFTESRPLIAHMAISENGTIEWRHEFGTAKRDEVIELVGEGFSQADIAKKVGLSKGRVSQIVSESDREAEKQVDGALEFSPKNPRPSKR